MTLIYPKWMPVMKAVLCLDKPYVSMISKMIDVSYSHVSGVVLELQRRKLVHVIEHGSKRTKVLELTPKGREVAEAILILDRLVPEAMDDEK